MFYPYCLDYEGNETNTTENYVNIFFGVFQYMMLHTKFDPKFNVSLFLLKNDLSKDQLYNEYILIIITKNYVSILVYLSQFSYEFSQVI